MGLATALVLAVALGACSKSAPAPRLVIQPEPMVVEPESPSVAELRDESDTHFWKGMEAQATGDNDLAELQFDAAVQIFLDADIPQGQEVAFRSAFDDLMQRIQAQQPAVLEVPAESAATELPGDEIPPLSSAEINMLRSRMADTLPAMPRFTIHVPADNPRVIEAVEYLAGNRRTVVEEGLTRATQYMPMIKRVFEEEGVPAELAWIPLIESLFKTTARSRVAAVGLWQFMAPTARLYGLRVDWYVDERRDPIKATRAIARFIRDYHEEFDDWHLAIAAYNGGKGRVARAMQRAGVDNFWSLATTTHLPRETREFVPKILAAILIGSDPEAYDFMIEPMPEYSYDEVTVDSMTDLEVIAEAAGTSLETIRDLNPQILRRTTPNVPEYSLRVPVGHGRDFRVAFAAIPRADRLRVAEHVMARGETLSDIGDAYGVSWRAIADFNNISNPRRIRVGERLLIPVSQGSSPNAPTVASRDLTQGSGHTQGDKITHTVRRGESLWVIANAYGTTVNDVKRWNGLSSDTLQAGANLDVYYRTRGEAPAVAASSPAAVAASVPVSNAEVAPAPGANRERISYTIQRGDTLSSIARSHGVGVADIRAWNDMSGDRIYPGRRLTLHMAPGSESLTYTIRRGDNLSNIARRFGVTISQLTAWNGISARTTLYPGNRLMIRGRAAEARE